MERRIALWVGVLVSAFGIVALPAQYVPVLFIHDVAFIAFSCAALAGGAVIAAVGQARNNPDTLARSVIVTTFVAVAISAGGVVFYRGTGGVGWPTFRILLGPMSAVGGTLVGYGLGALLRNAKRWANHALAVIVMLTWAGLTAYLAAVGTDYARTSLISNGRTCSEHDEIRYCYYEGYEPFVARWERAVRPVLDHVPVPLELGVVAQRVGREGVPGEPMAIPGPAWDDGDVLPRVAIALDVANFAVGAGPRLVTTDHGEPTGPCWYSPDQGRGIVAWWLAAQVDPDATKALLDSEGWGDALSGSEYGEPSLPPGADYARVLLNKPVVVVERTLVDKWGVVTSPRSTLEQVARVLGINYVEERAESPGDRENRLFVEQHPESEC